MCFMMSCNLVSVHSYISWCGLMNSLYFEVIEDFDHLWENYQIGLKKRGKKKNHLSSWQPNHSNSLLQ